MSVPAVGILGRKYPPYSNAPRPPYMPDIKPPYEEYLGTASYDVCACCGFEYGNDDNPGEGCHCDAFADYLHEWIANGCPWFHEHKKPKGWQLIDQLKAVGLEYRLDEQPTRPPEIWNKGD